MLSDSVIRNKKPVYWCSTCTTALAEAEVEYHDHTSPSIYVKFKVEEDLSDIHPSLKGDDTYVVIWTTTPWTLRANLAVCVHPELDYVLVATSNGYLLLAEALHEDALSR